MATDSLAETSSCRAMLLTPTGRGAVATVAVQGAAAMSAVSRFFHPFGRIALADAAVNAILVGHWRGDRLAGEEVVVARRGPELVEIHCHGGMAPSRAIMDSLISVGAVEQSCEAWLGWTCETRIQQQAWLALSLARTERTARILLDQFRGRLRHAIDDIRQTLDDAREQREAAQKIDDLLKWASVGLHLTTPWRVVLVGPPNVGKSSLINALLGYERSIVFDEPGTTRDVVTATTALDGWPVELSDTAGFRQSDSVLEQEGVRRARSQLAKADLVIIVTDSTATDSSEMAAIMSEVRDPLIVANKCDLVPSPTPRKTVDWIATSALVGTGVQELAAAIVQRLVPAVPPAGEPIPFLQSQVDQLRTAQAACAIGDLATAQACLAELLRTPDRNGSS